MRRVLLIACAWTALIAGASGCDAELARRLRFVGTIEGVTEERLGLSWRAGCPVPPSELRLVHLSYWGMDGQEHEGELIVHRKIAAKMVTVFRVLWNEKFPINKMETTEKHISQSDIDANGNFIPGPNVADNVNITSAFICRPTTRGTSFSMHAYGLAVDINPVNNPYIKGDLIIPLNGTYDTTAPGTVVRGGVVVKAMTKVGMKWGGNFKSLKDYMHFSLNGR